MNCGYSTVQFYDDFEFIKYLDVIKEAVSQSNCPVIIVDSLPVLNEEGNNNG